MVIEVREGQAAAARQMARGGCRIFANYCCSVRVCAPGQICGLTSRQHLEKKFLVLISASDRDETPLFGGFSYIGNCQNPLSSPHAVYTDLTISESCIDQDLWPTSGYHKQWPETPPGAHTLLWKKEKKTSCWVVFRSKVKVIFSQKQKKTPWGESPRMLVSFLLCSGSPDVGFFFALFGAPTHGTHKYICRGPLRTYDAGPKQYLNIQEAEEDGRLRNLAPFAVVG